MTNKSWGKIFLPTQLSFGLGAGEFSYNYEPLGEILTVSYPRSALQARDYKHNQQTNRSQKSLGAQASLPARFPINSQARMPALPGFQKRAVTLGKKGSGVSAPAARRPPRDSHILRPRPALAIVGPGNPLATARGTDPTCPRDC